MGNIDIALLKPHPRNTEIYGEEDIKELAEKIKLSGWIKPLVINQDNIIISGHRRLRACLNLGINDVPYERISFKNKNEELERLLLENESREKTEQQKTREGMIWEEVIKVKADERMKSGKAINPSENSPKGRTTDIVAEKVGVGSGKKYETNKKVVKEIDKLKDEGKEKEAQVLSTALEKSTNSAKNLLDADLTNVNDELKDKIINGEIPVKEAIKEIKKASEIGSKENLTQQEEIKSDIENSEETNIPQNSAEADIANNKEAIEKMKSEFKTNTNIITDNIALDFETDKNNFISNMNKYIELEETLSNLDNAKRKKMRNDIEEIRNTLDKITDILF